MNNEISNFIKNQVDSHKIVLFMKGTADFPQCGFSSMVVSILQKLNTDFKDINVLESIELRQGIKEYSDWPTIPQLYINGEFVGGCDIAKEMYESGELKKLIS
ncbi:MAG TPA: Grx4 family monothiol glutaredoxin [Candidatus Megaira endosymbiont of Nemacystus decipiens]|nr:Grx4 family monothiol glutaredoxin [Candidatus Megaera endosymbiont of Nemacystus decipiens]